MNEDLKRVLKLIVVIFLFFLGIKFFIFAFPFIILVGFCYLIYKKVKEKNFESNNTNNNYYGKKSKSDSILEGKVIKERLDD